MATRTEAVRISAVDDFSTPVAKMAAQAALFKRELDSLDGTNVRTAVHMRETARGVDNLNASARRGTADINQYSGRLRLWADALITIGPALIPIGAVAIPAVTGLAAAFGFAATGAATAVVAFQGVGDALEAVNKARLEPTVENLQAARDAMEQIAPPAREFVRELADMGPAFKAVRDAAGAGLFPGLVESLGHVEDVLPRVASLFEAVGDAVGDLAADGAESLAGPRWAEFIRFMEDEAPHAIGELGAALGDLIHGMAELWMAFTPLNDDFTGWLRDSAAAFDEWASGLSQTDGFQEFVDYIRANGPKVADALGSLGNALLQVVEAAAPLGGPTLTIIARLADVLAAIADSDLGTPLFALAAGLAAVNRATKVMGASSLGVAGLTNSLKNLAKVGGTLLVLEGAGRAIEALDNSARGVAALTTTLLEANNAKFGEVFGGSIEEALSAASKAEGGFSGFAYQLEQIGEQGGAVGTAVVNGLGQLTGLLPSMKSTEMQVERAAQAFTSLDSALVSIASAQGLDAAGQAFRSLADSQNLTVEQTEELLALLPQFGELLAATGSGASDIESRAGNLRNFFLEGSAAADQLAGSTRNLSDALAELSGWLDKREAMRGFTDAMKELDASIDSGKVNQWAANVDNVGRTLIQVATSLKGAARSKFIDQTIAGLREMAEGAGPRAAAEIQALINQLKRLDGTKAEPQVGMDETGHKAGAAAVKRRQKALDFLKANPEVDLNDALFAAAFSLTVDDLQWLDRKTSVPTVNVDGNAVGTLAHIQSLIHGINDKTVTITTIHRSNNAAAINVPGNPAGNADGGTVPVTGLPYADRHPYLLADGEEVISNRHGQADRHRDLLKAINAGRLADGGTAGRGADFFHPDGARFEQSFISWNQYLRMELRERARDLDRWLKASDKSIASQEKDVAASREFRDSLRSASDALSSAVAGKFMPGSDLVGEDATLESIMLGLATLEQQGSNYEQYAFRLNNLGLDGDALQWVLDNFSNSQLQMLIEQGAGQIGAFESQFNATNRQANRAGETAGFVVFGERLAEANEIHRQNQAELREANRLANRREKRLERIEKRLEGIPAATGREVGRAINRASGDAARRNSRR